MKCVPLVDSLLMWPGLQEDSRSAPCREDILDIGHTRYQWQWHCARPQEERLCCVTRALHALVAFKRTGGLHLVDHGNWFYGVFWQKTMRSISCFLPYQKILILTKVITLRRLALMCNSIACANFNRDFPKMDIFQTSIPYWAYSFHGIILKLGRH